MSIPPFPPQHLAKLVLGYLADEQLMTAYDEFLQASPYLDAMQNEYDRIFMTSLKSVVADFWAVKLYVESCKPYSLRKRLLGCRNQLEVVKFLIDNIDISKFQPQDTNKKSLEHKNVTPLERSISCEMCNLQKLPSCVCKNKSGQQSSTLCAKANESKSLESLVETTSLSDLPGNINKKKKQVKILQKDCVDAGSLDACNISVKSSPINSQVAQNRLDNTRSCSPFPVQEKHEVNASIVSHFTNPRTDLNELNTNRLSSTGTFQDFSSGIRGCESTTAAVPDSSTSKNMNYQNLTPQEAPISSSASTVSKAHILLTVGTMNTNVQAANTQDTTANTNDITPKNYIGNLRPKPADHKVTILSDIKVNNTYTKAKADIVPDVLKNTTSTPLMQMQTILINGTPVYKQSQINSKRNFTKDEIMAMPTIIVVPTSNSLQSTSNVQSQTTESLSTPQVSSIESSTQSLGPLVIDVPSSSSELSRGDPIVTDLHSNVNTSQNSTQGMLVKTVDIRNSSAPKDVQEASTKSTPQMLPPPRKSSSTPRRTSHVRVLDFTTPRRILKESICEQTENGAEVEVIISKSPNLHMLASPMHTDNKVSTSIDNINESGSSKENDSCPIKVPRKKKNWDADLRAVAITNAKEDIPTSRIQPRCRPRSKPAKNNKSVTSGTTESNKVDIHIIENSNTNVKNDPLVLDKSLMLVQETVNLPVNSTINITTGDKDWNPQDNDQLQNKSNSGDPVETPEMDRTSLQNAIGVKLNISDLLETPYKQALYDIQMETPRFLGPDLPGEPLSDIKIMNIPTPLFLNTPKPINATPSSYSSRPTDYSSGGSYYKPDDQDYFPDDLPASVSKESEVVHNVTDAPLIEERNSKSTRNARSSRPMRNCAKNVSYYNSPLNSKTNEACNSQIESSSSESTKGSKCVPKKVEKAARSQKENKKRSNLPKKRKTPIKKETPKSFVKIKARRVTPIKKGVKSKKKTPDVDTKKRMTGKEKIIGSTPVAIPVPTKSRRKSSTPRKLQCTKNYESENFVEDNDHSDNISSKKVQVINVSPAVVDSDTELLTLRWSDDGSQDAKLKDVQSQLSESAAEIEDINKIKEYIDAGSKKTEGVTNSIERTGNLHIDLVKRGFDIETAKIIERDLLDVPPSDKDNLISKRTDALNIEVAVQHPSETKADTLQVQEEEEDGDDDELVVDECTEDSFNYITCNHDDTKGSNTGSISKLKDSFSMEVCMDDGIVIRLRATPFSVVLDEDPQGIDIEETAMAVDSISNIEKLYTPMKDSVRAQVYEIFDSTLTSLDTPLKPSSPKRKECDTTVTEIVLVEVEKIDERNTNKRKRLHSSDSEDLNDNKKPKAEYLLNSTNIKNIDIETVLSKLHGP